MPENRNLATDQGHTTENGNMTDGLGFTSDEAC